MGARRQITMPPSDRTGSSLADPKSPADALAQSGRKTRSVALASALFAGAALWAALSPTADFFEAGNWDGLGVGALMVVVSVLIPLAHPVPQTRRFWMLFTGWILLPWAAAIVVGQLRPFTTTFTVSAVRPHVRGGPELRTADGKRLGASRHVIKQVQVGGTYRCAGHREPAFGATLYDCRPAADGG